MSNESPFYEDDDSELDSIDEADMFDESEIMWIEESDLSESVAGGRAHLSLTAVCCICAALTGAVCLVVVGVWYVARNSPEHVVEQKLEKADAMVQDGKLLQAVRIYKEVATGSAPQAESAQQRILALLNGPVQDAPIDETIEVFRFAAQARLPEALQREIAKTGFALVDKHSDVHPKRAKIILNLIGWVSDDRETIATKQRELLEKVVAKHPTDLTFATDLATLLEQEGKLAECEAVLTPLKHDDHMRETEAGRILGQIYADQGNLDDARMLLLPYCKRGLEALRYLEQEYQDVYESAYQSVLEQLKQGTAPKSFYDRHNVADEATKSELVQEYINSKLKDDETIIDARKSVMNCSSVVPVVIDLAMVMLRRARSLQDPQARQAELKEAEVIFLAIRGLAGKSKQYKLFLGQVYFWLGKHDEAHELYEQLLEASERDATALIDVANIYRDVGLLPQSRKLIEEAYEKEVDERKKQNMASLRASTSLGLDDRIEWLGRSNKSDLRVKASLANAMGHRAIQKGNELEALELYREAIATYDAMPETSSTLNNAALPCFSLFYVTGDQADFDRGMEKLDRAVALSPSDSILLGNAARQILQGALFDIVADAIDLTALKSSANVALLAFLIDSESEREVIAERLRSDTGVAKALSYFEKVMLLAPMNAEPYRNLAAIHYVTNDGHLLQQLLENLEAAELDRATSMQRTLEFYRGGKDSKIHEELRQSRDRAAETVERSRSVAGATFAVAVDRLTSQNIAIWMLGEDVDAAAAVQLTEEAYAAAPSSASRQSLQSALALRAVTSLADQNDQFSAFVAQRRRSLHPTFLLAVFLNQGGPFVANVIANDDVQRMSESIKEQSALFPLESSPWKWAFLQVIDKDAAAEMADRVKTYKLSRVRRRIDALMSPISTSTSLNAYWELMILGQNEQANMTLKESAERGMPLPFALE